jgi:hypothetical protein
MSLGAITVISKVAVSPVAGRVAVMVDVPGASGAAHSYLATPFFAPGQPLFADQSAT